MATNTYIGPSGGNWFDAANWSLGIIPAAGDLADLVGANGPDATAATIAGVAIDLSEAGAYFGGLVLPTFNLLAGQLGTPSAPVAIDATADSGTADSAVIDFSTLDGSITVERGQGLVIAVNVLNPGPIVNGDITVKAGAALDLTAYSPQDLIVIPPPAVTLNGQVSIDGGTFDIFSGQLTGTGSIVVADGGTLSLAYNPLLISIPTDTVPVAFGASGGTLDAGALPAGYGGAISNFGPGDTIIGDAGRIGGGDPLLLNFANDVLTVTDRISRVAETFNFKGAYNASDFQITPMGGTYTITYGPTDNYTGPSGGNWFDAANWSTGAVPTAGVLARVYGTNGPDATSGIVSGITIDLSGPSLAAAQLGTQSAPVTLETTNNAGQSPGFTSSVLSVTTLDGSIRVMPNADLTLTTASAGTTINGDITGNIDTRVSIAGPGPATINGTIDVGMLVLAVPTAGSGSIAVGGRVEIEGTTHDGVALPVDFGSQTGALDVTRNPGGYAGVISGFNQYGDEIIAPFVGAANSTPIVSFANDVLTIVQPGTTGPDATETFTFAGPHTLANFDVFTTNQQTIAIDYNPCFATGTRILTDEGDRPVENLVTGDIVRLYDGSVASIIWIGHRRQRSGAVVRVRAGALGENVPSRDLIVSTDHGLYLDGVLVQAGLLVNGDTIVSERRETVTFWHVELDRHAILLAESAPAESYLDTGNRRQFANCALAYDQMDTAAHGACAEMVFAGIRLDAITARLVSVPAHA